MSDRQGTIPMDVHFGGHEGGDLGMDEAADALLSRWMKDAEKPSDPEEKEKTPKAAKETAEPEANTNEEAEAEDGDKDSEDHAEEGDAEDNEGETEGEDEDNAGDEPKVASDEHEVELTVDGETKRVSVKDLKRLYGQEASLTRKSQEVADLRKKAETEEAKHVGAVQKMLERAKARWEPYSKIDFLLASRELEPSDFQQLRKDAAEAWGDVKFLTEELDGFVADSRTKYQQQFADQAKACIATLTDPEKGIKGWNEQTYNDVCTFAVKNGMSADVVKNIVDPAAIKIIHMAMQYEKAKSVQKAAVTKIAKAPKNVVKTTGARSGSTKAEAKAKALDKLKQTGSTDDAADAFLARWTAQD